jgi:hypothetical protein
MVGNPDNGPAMSSNDNHYKQGHFGGNEVHLKASDFKKDVRELR